MVDKVKKRDGKTVVDFEGEKIKDAISKAAHTVHITNPKKAVDTIFPEVLEKVNTMFAKEIPSVTDIEDIVIQSSIDKGYPEVGSAYQTYKNKRIEAKRVLKIIGSNDTTDASLLIESDSKENLAPWDRSKIVEQLKRETKLDNNQIKDISKKVENTIIDLYQKGVRKLRTTQVRGITDLFLTEEGLIKERRRQELLGIPVSDLEEAVSNKSLENSNITNNNPEAVNLFIAESILKPYALENVFSEDVADAHLNGAIHIHDLGYINRVYCSSHSIEYIKKFGLKKLLANLESKANPANSASVLTQQMQTTLASLQMYYAGALGYGFLNVFYAPLLFRPAKVVKGEVDGVEWTFEKKDLEKLIEQEELSLDLKKEDIKHFEKKSERTELRELPNSEYEQIAQQLLFGGSQNAFSRGGQTLFIDFNIHTAVPDYLKKVPAIGPKGMYMIQKSDGSVEMIDDVPRFFNKDDPTDSRNGDADNSQIKDGKILTYGDFEKSAQKFAKALLTGWKKGDCDGRSFHFPKCDLHVDAKSFEDPEQEKLVDYAAQVTSENGSVYFMFDRGDGAVLAQCCRLKEKITDPTMLKYPEKLRFCGFQNVTINLAQAAYKGKTLEGTLTEIDNALELGLKAHKQKKEYIQKLLDNDGEPLRALGRPSDDGEPYIDLKKATYLYGIIGLNEAVQVLTGKQLHESKEAYDLGIRVIAHMNKKVNEFRDQTGLKFTLEESPAESATMRLAKIDLKKFEQAKGIIKGTEQSPYYTNSIHFAPGADVGLTDRIVGQSKFHDMIESGAIIHAYIGEKRPSAEAIKERVKNTLFNTRCSQLVFSPTYTECEPCGKVMAGEKELCENPGCKNHSSQTVDENTLSPVTRIVGYNARIKHWNKAQKQIYEDRKEAEEFYAGKSGRDLNWLYNPIKNDKVVITQFGKAGCPTCENLEKNVNQQIEHMGIKDKVEFKKIYLNERTEEGLAMAASYGIPLDTVPSLVIAGKNDYWMKTTSYAKKDSCPTDSCSSSTTHRSNLIRPSEIREQLEARLF